ncbi:MAG: response regulator [Parachlamydiaceae bacterium]
MTKLKKILLVEDDFDIQEIIKCTLSSIGGFSVDVCSSGEEALKKISHLKPQLILLDVMMPFMDGPTTLQHLKQMEEAASIPVIFITAKVQPHELASYEKMGVLGTISKPFDPMTLAEIVLQMWKKNGLDK